MFEPRPTLSPFVMSEAGELLRLPASVSSCLQYRPLASVDLYSTPLLLSPLETKVSAYTWFRCSSLKCPPSTMLHPPDTVTSLSCPKNKIRWEKI